MLEDNCVPKTVRFCVLVVLSPRTAPIRSFIKPRKIAFAAGHDDGCIRIEALNAAKVQLLSSRWNGAGLPLKAAVFRAQNCTVGARGPGDASAERVNAAQAGGGIRGLDGPLSMGCYASQRYSAEHNHCPHGDQCSGKTAAKLEEITDKKGLDLEGVNQYRMGFPHRKTMVINAR